MKDYKFVGFWQRFFMNILDFIILFSISFLISLFFDINGETPELNAKVYLLILNISALIPAVYTIGFWSTKGATPGKLIRRAKIVDATTGQIPSLWKSIVRYVCFLVSIFFPWLGVFWIGADSRKQAWHDKIAGTVVVKPNAMKIPKDAGYDYELVKQESLFPSNATEKDNKKWKWGKFLIFFSLISIFAVSYLFFGDEKLFPEAEKWLYESAFIEENPQDNGFYYLLGMFASEAADPFQTGYDWVQKQNDYILELAKSDQYFENENKIEEIKLDIDSQNMLNAFNNDNFISYCIKNKKSIQQNYQKYSFITDRIIELHNTKYFRNTTIPHFANHDPILMNLVRFKLLENASIAILYSEDKTEKAIKILDDSNKFARKLAEISDTWMPYMVSQILLQRNLQFYNLLLDYKESELLKNEILEIQSITVPEREITKIAKREFNFNTHLLINMFNFKQNAFVQKNHYIEKEFVKKSRSILFKPHKSANESFKINKILTRLSEMDAKDFSRNTYNRYIIEPGILDYLNNFMGSMLIFIYDPVNDKYIAKFHDIDAYINMLKLKVMILDENIPNDQISAFLEAHSDSLYNPYTQKAIDWDAENSILFFDGPYKDEHSVRKLKL